MKAGWLASRARTGPWRGPRRKRAPTLVFAPPSRARAALADARLGAVGALRTTYRKRPPPTLRHSCFLTPPPCAAVG